MLACDRGSISKQKYLLLSTLVMTNIFPQVETSHTQDQGIVAGFKQIDEDLQKLVIGIIEFMRIFAPKFF